MVREAKFEDGEFKVKDRDTGEWKKLEEVDGPDSEG